MKRKHKLIGIGILGSVLIAGVAWVIWGNTSLELNADRSQCAKLPKEFAGFGIAHIMKDCSRCSKKLSRILLPSLEI